jgi:hypothetical protein
MTRVLRWLSVPKVIQGAEFEVSKYLERLFHGVDSTFPEEREASSVLALSLQKSRSGPLSLD